MTIPKSVLISGSSYSTTWITRNILQFYFKQCFCRKTLGFKKAGPPFGDPAYLALWCHGCSFSLNVNLKVKKLVDDRLSSLRHGSNSKNGSPPKNIITIKRMITPTIPANGRTMSRPIPNLTPSAMPICTFIVDDISPVFTSRLQNRQIAAPILIYSAQ